jgi:hypothetical protein
MYYVDIYLLGTMIHIVLNSLKYVGTDSTWVENPHQSPHLVFKMPLK